MKIKNILVSQPEPKVDGHSPYKELADKHKLRIDFRHFIKVEGVPSADFRKDKINIAEHTAVIMTSRNAVDHFFRMCEEMRVPINQDLKYFCQTEAIAYYLQKYVIYRKRKVYHGKSSFADLMAVIKKHKDERYLLPSSDVQKTDVPQLLHEGKIKYTRAILYRTVSNDLSEVNIGDYEMLVFFSPAGIKSLYQNFPTFVQGETHIAVFGSSTLQAAQEAGLEVQVVAPSIEFPSMTMALEDHIKRNHKAK
ncbi:uroporphyrinogen-III synthase [bacterium]|nr:uroporphyrinogen-III synthase [bacterium]